MLFIGISNQVRFSSFRLKLKIIYCWKIQINHGDLKLLILVLVHVSMKTPHSSNVPVVQGCSWHQSNSINRSFTASLLIYGAVGLSCTCCRTREVTPSTAIRIRGKCSCRNSRTLIRNESSKRIYHGDGKTSS